MNINQDISQAQTLPGSFYTDHAIFDQVRKHVFEHSWQLIEENLENEVDPLAYPFHLLPGFLDEPLLITKNSNGDKRCLSNVCTHRANVLLDQPHSGNALRCTYHGRSFDLAGKLIGAPGFEGARNFPCNEDNLPELPIEDLGPLAFTSLSPSNSFRKTFSPFFEEFSWYPFDKLTYKPEMDGIYEIDSHWALYVDNYLEGFHIPYVHPGLAKTIDFQSYSTVLFNTGNLQAVKSKAGEYSFKDVAEAPSECNEVGAYYYWFFPNLMFNFYPWGLSLNIVLPQALNKTKVIFKSYVLNESLLGEGAGGDLHQVEMEDEKVVLNVQKGIGSRLYNRGRFSPRLEKGVHQFQTMLSSSINK